MNHLVCLDTQAGELEKILSGVKSMIAKEFDPATAYPVRPGDSLYFLRNNDECILRVKATVVRVVPLANGLNEDLSHTLKELQPRLQLTEDQYNYWSTKKQVLLVEFDSADKIASIHVTSNNIKDRSDWIAFEDFSLVT
jgi:hypothetical protein